MCCFSSQENQDVVLAIQMKTVKLHRHFELHFETNCNRVYLPITCTLCSWLQAYSKASYM